METNDVSVKRPLPEPRHLGDGVYASFDGYNINIAVNHHNNHVVALEPRVVRGLFEYAREVSGQ